MGATLDESYNEDDDFIYPIDGITVVMDKALRETLGPVAIDFEPEKGIVVSSENKTN